jgi:hypothetical protein
MNANEAEVISRPQVEKALWAHTGWRGDQVVIDGLMIVVDAYVASIAEELAHSSEAFREGYYHALVTMAEAIMDTGGQMRLVPPAEEERSTVLPVTVDDYIEAILTPEKPAEELLRGVKEEPGDEEDVAAAVPVVPVDEALDEWDGMIRCNPCSAREGHDVYKPYDEFHKDSKGAHGRKTRCRACESKRKHDSKQSDAA